MNEHIAQNPCFFLISYFLTHFERFASLEFFNVLRHYAKSLVGNQVGGGAIMAWPIRPNRTKTIYKD